LPRDYMRFEVAELDIDQATFKALSVTNPENLGSR
jgi:hypothetical protein